jgi:hypothetical protein
MVTLNFQLSNQIVKASVIKKPSKREMFYMPRIDRPITYKRIHIILRYFFCGMITTENVRCLLS